MIAFLETERSSYGYNRNIDFVTGCVCSLDIHRQSSRQEEVIPIVFLLRQEKSYPLLAIEDS